LKETEEIIGICRESAAARLILGGSGYSLAPRELLQHFDVDFGIVGEGEEVLIELIRSFESGALISPSAHLLVKGKTLPDSTEGAKAVHLGNPDRSLFETRRYLEEGGMANVQTKRGCPFSCIYCTYPLLEGKKPRFREVEDVIGEIGQLAEAHGIDYVYFVDDIFNYPMAYAEQMCREMAKTQLKVKWTAFVNPGFVTRDLLMEMKGAGCAGIEFGTDSGSPRMLKNLRKSFTSKDVIRASRLCSDLGINYCHYLLFGGPGEDEETIGESFRLMDRIDPTAVIAMLGIRIYPGTELEQISLKEGGIQKDTNLIYPHFYISAKLKGKLVEIIREKSLQRKQWIVPGLEINISENLLRGIRRFGVRGPLWELVGKMKRPRIRPLGG